MLIRNRIPIDVPVVDEVDVDGLEPGALVAVEVVAEGRAYRAMADPIALSAALHIGPDQIHRCRRVLPRAGGFPGDRGHPAHDAGRTARGRRRLRRLHCRRAGGAVLAGAGARGSAARLPGAVVRMRLRAIPAAEHGIAVDDAFFTDLSSIDNGAWLRRGVVETRGTVVAMLAAERSRDAAQHDAGADRQAGPDHRHRTAGRGLRCTHHARSAARLHRVRYRRRHNRSHRRRPHGRRGGRGGVDHGRGRTGARHPACPGRAGQTDTGRPGGGPARRPRGGRPPGLPRRPGIQGCDRAGCAPAEVPGWCRFRARLAAEEWRSLRLAIKQETVAANIARAMSAFDEAAERAGARGRRSARRRVVALGGRIRPVGADRRGTGQHRRGARPAVRGGIRPGSSVRRRGQLTPPSPGTMSPRLNVTGCSSCAYVHDRGSRSGRQRLNCAV